MKTLTDIINYLFTLFIGLVLLSIGVLVLGTFVDLLIQVYTGTSIIREFIHPVFN